MANDTTEMKICPCKGCERAGEPQPLDNFGRNDSVASGRSYHCRKCATRTQAEWKKAHPEAARKWRRSYIERNKAKNLARREAQLREPAMQAPSAPEPVVNEILSTEISISDAVASANEAANEPSGTDTSA